MEYPALLLLYADDNANRPYLRADHFQAMVAQLPPESIPEDLAELAVAEAMALVCGSEYGRVHPYDVHLAAGGVLQAPQADEARVVLVDTRAAAGRSATVPLLELDKVDADALGATIQSARKAFAYPGSVLRVAVTATVYIADDPTSPDLFNGQLAVADTGAAA